jgi:hypothetical protein
MLPMAVRLVGVAGAAGAAASSKYALLHGGTRASRSPFDCVASRRAGSTIQPAFPDYPPLPRLRPHPLDSSAQTKRQSHAERVAPALSAPSLPLRGDRAAELSNVRSCPRVDAVLRRFSSLGRQVIGPSFSVSC